MAEAEFTIVIAGEKWQCPPSICIFRDSGRNSPPGGGTNKGEAMLMVCDRCFWNGKNVAMPPGACTPCPECGGVVAKAIFHDAVSELKRVARAICQSRTCEGVSCCQWPANGGRTNCPVENGGYDDAARAAIAAINPK